MRALTTRDNGRFWPPCIRRYRTHVVHSSVVAELALAIPQVRQILVRRPCPPRDGGRGALFLQELPAKLMEAVRVFSIHAVHTKKMRSLVRNVCKALGLHLDKSSCETVRRQVCARAKPSQTSLDSDERSQQLKIDCCVAAHERRGGQLGPKYLPRALAAGNAHYAWKMRNVHMRHARTREARGKQAPRILIVLL